MLDIATGRALKTFAPTDIENVVIPASPSAVLDGNGYIKFVYVANLTGSVYRFDFRTAGTVSSYSSPAVNGTTGWTVNKIFQPASGGQPVYHRVEPGTITETTRYLYFGTGNQEMPVSDGGTGKFYAIMDSDGSTATVLESSLTNLTSNLVGTTATAAPTLYGWFVNLGSIGLNSGGNTIDNNTHSAEKVLSDPVIFYNNVYFTTFTPNPSDPCNGGGVARVYGINMQNATAGLLRGHGRIVHQREGRLSRIRRKSGGRDPVEPVPVDLSERAIVHLHRLLNGRHQGDQDRFASAYEDDQVVERDILKWPDR